MHERITGKRIKLKRPVYDVKTAEKIYSVIDRCRDVFLPWLGWVKDTNSPKDTLKFLEVVNKDWNSNTQFVYEISVDKNFVGLISVVNIAWPHKRAEISYWLDTDYTGCGYMAEAIAQVYHKTTAELNQAFMDYVRLFRIDEVLEQRMESLMKEEGLID